MMASYQSSSSVSYQFKNETSWHKVESDQPCMTVQDLKNKIREKKQIKSRADLMFKNIETGEIYTDNKCRLPKNVSLSIRRIPKTGLQNAIEADEIDKTTSAILLVQEISDEEKKMTQSLQQAINYLSHQTIKKEPTNTKIEVYNQNNGAGSKFNNFNSNNENNQHQHQHQNQNQNQNQNKYVTFGNALPPNYKCHRCGEKGHFIQHCPTNGNPDFDIKVYKNPTGIPSRFLTKHDLLNENNKDYEDGPEVCKSKTDDSFYKVQPNKRSFSQFYEKSNFEDQKVKKQQSHYMCPLCSQQLKNAVFITCCFVSFCSECIKQVLVDENAICPICINHINHNDLQENFAMRSIIDRMK